MAQERTAFPARKVRKGSPSCKRERTVPAKENCWLDSRLSTSCWIASKSSSARSSSCAAAA
ncbi:hypothetical protein [Blautia sp. TF12-31AT]|uniref:hypothetical protein n=1 Tax=Blautia sp. TF12-31AT TaxID=2292989 RepID=UPI001FAAA3F9|nr:hypothetical protein [Blautia sp. TF12-31AT]